MRYLTEAWVVLISSCGTAPVLGVSIVSDGTLGVSIGSDATLIGGSLTTGAGLTTLVLIGCGGKSPRGLATMGGGRSFRRLGWGSIFGGAGSMPIGGAGDWTLKTSGRLPVCAKSLALGAFA